MSDAIYTTQDVIQKLVAVLKAEGPVLLAQIPEKLKPIDYRQFTTGKLKTWLCEFPEFAMSEDGLSLTLSGGKHPAPVSEPAASAAPAVMPEVRCMHGFAYMNFWNQNLKRLRLLGEFPDLKADTLRDFLGRQLMQRLLLGQIKLIVSEDQQPHLVADTGLQTQDGYAVYAILSINPANSDGTKQFWVMKGFCSDSETDLSELGQWLRAQATGGLPFDHTDLQERLDAIKTQIDTVRTATNRLLLSLEEGSCPDLSEENRLSRLLAQYEAQWESLLAFLEDYPGISPEDAICLPSLRAVASEESFRDNLLRQALELFETVATGTQAFFREYGWEAGENCTPMQDLAALQKACSSALADISAVEEFSRILDYYRTFRDAVSATKADDAYYANVTAATEHFRELPQFRTAAKLLRGTPEEERAFLDGIEDIAPLLSQYIATAAATDSAPILPDSNLDLLHLALRADREYVQNWPQYVKEALPQESSLQEIAVPGPQDPAAELTCFAAANRLYQADCPTLAERYWILGLHLEQAQCAPQLLEYYRETKQEEAFALIWARFHEQIAYSPLDETFWFSTVCQQDPEQALRMGRENIHLQYQPDYLANLIPAAQRLGLNDLAETLRLRLERFQAHPEPNPLEAAVIADDRSGLLALCLPETLEEMGYDAQQIQTIRSVLEADGYPAGTSPYDIGSRLYAFQGNFHSLAEQWLWRGVSKQNRGSYGILLLLLTNERRWSEAIDLYAHHADSQKRFEDCRRLYLIAHYYNSPAKAQSVFLENLQDALSILNTMPSFREKLGLIAQREEHELYALLLKLHAATTAHPYLWSIICEDRSLRDQVSDETLLASMGLNVAATGEAYRSGNYPHGRDAASIALRLYALAGNFAGGAETAARMAGHDPLARRLLWTIYQQQKNETALYALLSEDAALRKEHYTEYLSLVFARGEYGTFLTLLEESGDPSEQLLLQRAIAELTLGNPMTDSAEICADAAASCAPEICLDLLRAAVGQEDLVAEVIDACFDQWLSLPARQLQALVTCDGNATARQLAQLQTLALQRQNLPLAVYLRNAQKVEGAEEESRQLYQQLLEELTACEPLQQAARIHKLKILYPHRAEDLSALAVSMSIRSILLQAQDAEPQQVAEKLADAISALKSDPAALDPLLDALRGSEYCREPRVYTAIRGFAKQIGRPTDALLFFHGERREDTPDPQFQDLLINLYWNALVEGRFPQQIAAEAEDICFQSMDQKGSVVATLNIAMLRQLAGQPIYAHAVLGYLAEATNSQANLALYLSNALGIGPLPAALQLPDPLPDALQLFEEILDQGSSEQVLQYLAFCRRFLQPNSNSSRLLQELQASPELTEQQSILALQLLCSGPKRREFWELCYRIPFNVGDVGRAAFLQLCCQNAPGHWREYVQLCEALSVAPKRLSDALLGWCQTKLYKEHEDFRQYVEEKLDADPSYLENLNDPQNIAPMTQILCDRVKSAKELLHAQVHAVTKFAVLSGDPTALTILQKELGHLLFGVKSNLGFAALCHLLLAERFEEAGAWLSGLHDSVAMIACRPLVEKLFAYSQEERINWTRNPSSRILLELLLPNGTPPGYERVARLVSDAFLEGNEKDVAAALLQLLWVFPNDYATAYELFELCKADFDGSIPVLHQALLSLSQLSANYDISTMAERFSDANARTHHLSLAVLNQLIIHWQAMDTIDDGWDFGRSTAQGLAERNVINIDAAGISEIEQKVRDSLAFQSAEIAALRAQAWLANITGNWTAYLTQAYKTQQAEDVFFPDYTICYLGLAQSILRMMDRTDATALPGLLQWLNKLPLGTQLPDPWNRQRNWALAFYRKGSLAEIRQVDADLADQLLRFPVDNGRLCSHWFYTVLIPRLSDDPKQIHLLASAFCFLGGRYAMFLLYRLANRCFKQGQDGSAWGLFNALYRTSSLWNITHNAGAGIAREETSRPFQLDREEYQSKLRISGAFCGESACLAKLANPQLNPWTNINLILCLASARPHEVDRLIELLHPDCVPFSRQIHRLISRHVSDEEKLALLDDLSFPELQRYYFAQILSFKTSRPHYLLSEEAQETASRICGTIYSTNASDRTFVSKVRSKTMLYKQLSLYTSGDTSHSNQPAPDPVLSDAEALPVGQEAVSCETCVYVAPDYVAHLTALEPDPQALKELQKQYQKPSSTAAKAEISRELYRYAIGADESPAACYRALLRYSVDRFYALYRDDAPASRQQAFQLLVTLMETDCCNVRSGAEYEDLVKLIREVGAAGLIRSYSKIQDLAVQYVAHTNAFHKMQSMIHDKMLLQNLEILSAVLPKLEQAYERFGNADQDKWRSSLNSAAKQIAAMNNAGDIKFHLRRIINAELAMLSNRARLEVKLLNHGVQAHTGVLTGIITNTGGLEAKDLTLQAFCDLFISQPYVLKQLPSKGGKAIFEIPYTCEESALMLEGHLSLSGKSGDALLGTQCDFSLPLGATSADALPFTAYSPDRAAFDFDEETGTVRNSGFFGRKAETEKLRELVAGDRFADFHSAIVYGVRRTGKTYLLEYFKTYVQHTHPECICIRIDVQGTDETIHGVFVKAVLAHEVVEAALSNCVREGEDVAAFRQKWEGCAAGDGEMNPNLIKVFFRELYELTGKSMFLLIDETDRLLQKLVDNHQETVLNNLLRTLSGLLDDDERKKYLQLVICGSNWLMHYATVGRDMQQLFQRVGDYKFSIGRLPKEDVMAVLRSVDIPYAEGTQDMIWEFTGGLVWFVKLLANAAIRRAKEARRGWVYPADVFYSLPDVVHRQNCEQFYEGCLPGSVERQMIDAMQSIAYRQDQYFSLTEVGERLDLDPAAVEKALGQLIYFEIAERHPTDPNRVRFTLDIYRRYFRSVYSAYPRTPEETIVFEPKNDTGVLVIYSDDEDLYKDDDVL